MLILGLLGMYFDAAVVFVTNSSLFFRLAIAVCSVLSISLVVLGLEWIDLALNERLRDSRQISLRHISL